MRIMSQTGLLDAIFEEDKFITSRSASSSGARKEASHGPIFFCSHCKCFVEFAGTAQKLPCLVQDTYRIKRGELKWPQLQKLRPRTYQKFRPAIRPRHQPHHPRTQSRPPLRRHRSKSSPLASASSSSSPPRCCTAGSSASHLSRHTASLAAASS